MQDSQEFCDELLIGASKLARMRSARRMARAAHTPAEAAVLAAEADHGMSFAAPPPHTNVPQVAVAADQRAMGHE